MYLYIVKIIIRAVMKTKKVLLIAMFFIITGASVQQVVAQEKTKEEQEQEQKIQQAIQEQKKAMADQKKAQEEALKAIQEQSGNLEDLKDLDERMRDVRVRVESADRFNDQMRMTLPRNGRGTGDRSFIYTPGDSFFMVSGGDTEGTTWDFSKSVRENTFKHDYTFDVEKSAKSVVMSVVGDCKSGEIRIKIVMPDGKNYSDIVIDEFGNLNWRKSFTISETENQDKTGEWKFQVNSTDATGYFKISIRSN